MRDDKAGEEVEIHKSTDEKKQNQQRYLVFAGIIAARLFNVGR